MRDKLFWIVLPFSFACIMLVLFKPAHHTLPVLGKVPDFSLTERNGDSILRSDLLGKVWVVDFMFTRCQGQCLFMTRKMLEIQGKVSRNEDLRWISISVDPLWDKPEVLSKYAEQYGADKNQWLFLTGDKEKIYELMKNNFHLGLEESRENIAEPIIHSNRFILVDRQGQIRGYYSTIEETDMEKIQRDIKRLLKQ